MKIIQSLLVLVVLSSVAMAQTTGVPGINDFTINGMGSGSTSGDPSTVLSVPAAPNTPLALGIDSDAQDIYFFWSVCAAAPGAAGLPSNAGCGLALQTIDLDFTCPYFYLRWGSFGGGLPTQLQLNLDSTALAGITMSIQAFLISPSCSGFPFTPIATQAYTLQF